ncbi:MAG: hypothetical protein AAF184_10560 [Pseudomonadota bacterium]
MRKRILLASLVVTAMAALSHATTPTNAMLQASSLTISPGDVQAAMTPQERQRFDELNRKYRAHQQQVRAISDPDVAATIREKLEQLKDQRDREFRVFRGLGNQTVQTYGRPPPTAAEILAIVIGARRSGGDGVLYPHWERAVRLVNNEVLNGSVRGSNSPPESGSSGIPAGPEVRAPIRFQDGAAVNTNPVWNADGQKCGPRPADAGLVCKCGLMANDVFGAVAAAGGKDCQWVKP